MNFRNYNILLLFLSFLVFSCNNQPENILVAKIDDNKIYADEFYLFNNKESFMEMDPIAREKVIIGFIHKKIIINKSEKNAKIQKRYFLEGLDFYLNSLLVERVIEEKVWKPILSPDSLTALYKRLKKEVGVNHIVIPFIGCLQTRTKRSREEALTLIQQIRILVNDKTLSFRDAAKKYSEGPSALNAGDLGYYRWGYLFEPVQTAAFSLNLRESSQPLLSRFGYHLVFVYGNKTIPLPPIADYVLEMEIFLRSFQGPEFERALAAFEKDLEIIYSPWINTEFLRTVYQEIIKINEPPLNMAMILKCANEGTVGRINDQKLSLNWVKTELQKNNPIAKAPIYKEDDIITNVKDLLFRYMARIESRFLDPAQQTELHTLAFNQYYNNYREGLKSAFLLEKNNGDYKKFEDSLISSYSIIINESFIHSQ